MSSRRGQSDGSFRLAWHAKPGAAHRMSTKHPYLLGRIRLADERDLARASYGTEPQYRRRVLMTLDTWDNRSLGFRPN